MCEGEGTSGEKGAVWQGACQLGKKIRGNIFAMMIVHPPRHLVWSTDTIDLNDPFQKRWLLRQTLMYGRLEDIRALLLPEIAKELDRLDLPKEIESLWRRYLEYLNARSD